MTCAELAECLFSLAMLKYSSALQQQKVLDLRHCRASCQLLLLECMLLACILVFTFLLQFSVMAVLPGCRA